MGIVIKIVGIGGSIRADSRTRLILELALDHLKQLGCKTENLDLRKLSLPFCDGSPEYPEYPDVKKLGNHVKEAHGLLLVTPEYHGNISGVLKNALDLLDEEHMQGKMVALISVLGGQSNANAINSLRLICRHLHAWVIPQQLIISEADSAFDGQLQLIDEDHRERLQELMQKLADATKKLGISFT